MVSGPNKATDSKNEKNARSDVMGSTFAPNLAVTLGAITRKVAAYVQTVPGAALATKADYAAEKTSQRNLSCSDDSRPAAGAKTSCINGVGDMDRSIGARSAPVTSSSNST